MVQVQSFPRLTKVQIVDDDTGYFIQSSELGGRLDIRFNTPREAVKHAVSEYWVIDMEDY